MVWTVIALTSRSKRDAAVFLNEFTKRQKAGLIDAHTCILAVPDPGHGDGRSVGSGGATLNALLAVAEYLSALAGHTVVNADCLLDARVLLLHMGGQPFTTFAATTASKDEHRELLYNVDLLMQSVDRLTHASPPGVWVASTTMLLRLPAGPHPEWVVTKPGVTAIAVPGTVEAAERHGVYGIDQATGTVNDLVYRGAPASIKRTALPDGQVPLVSGIAYLCPDTAEKLLALTITYPLNACTYLGADDGAEAFTLSFFLDILKCMCNDVTAASVSSEDTDLGITHPARLKARSVLWMQLNAVQMNGLLLTGASFVYIPKSIRARQTLHYPISLLPGDGNGGGGHASGGGGGGLFATEGIVWSRRTRAFIEGEIDPTTVVVNSVLGPQVTADSDAVVCHCKLQQRWTIGAGAYLCGVDDTVGVTGAGNNVTGTAAPRVVAKSVNLAEHRICLQPTDAVAAPPVVNTVWTVVGLDDDVTGGGGTGTAGSTEPTGTFCNQPWDLFFKQSGIRPSELWDEHETVRNAATAKLFAVLTQGGGGAVSADDVLWLQTGTPTPTQLERWRASWRLSYKTIAASADITSEVQWRNDLGYTIQNEILTLTLNFPSLGASGRQLAQRSGLTEHDWCLLPYFSACAIDGGTLGAGVHVLGVLDQVAMKTDSPGIAARTLACIADLLGQFAMGKGGLRSGPGRNNAFKPAFDLLEQGRFKDGVQALAEQRKLWLGSPDALIRAARHYESAAQILIRHAVMTVEAFIKTDAPVGVDQSLRSWTVCESAARIDIAGGWTDTPPVTYEHGGAVCNAAVLIDGKRPIGAKVRRIDEFKLTFVMGDHTLDVTELSQIATYTQPQSPGALLKAAFCCAKLVSLDYPGNLTLAEQLEKEHGCGFELHTWSNLPQGSGMGTSSILAGTVIAALWKTAGIPYTDDSLIHAVCLLEQMLTTGGGWQDQVGGIVKGVKMARSAAALPLLVQTEPVPCSPAFIRTFNEHLVLIYTGKTRLARNLLQNVIRQWYARSPELVQNADNLTANAEACVRAFQNEDLHAIGACLDQYWKQKKVMAPGCEPTFVRAMMDVMAPHAYGQSMAGAGGGGFMYVITKEPNMAPKMEELVRAAIAGVEMVKFHDVTVDEEGIVITTVD